MVINVELVITLLPQIPMENVNIFVEQDLTYVNLVAPLINLNVEYVKKVLS